MIKYVTEDGKSFNTAEEALKHDEYLENDKIEKEKKRKNQEKRLAEVNEAYDKYRKLLNKYYDDYPNDYKSINLLDLILK